MVTYCVWFNFVFYFISLVVCFISFNLVLKSITRVYDMIVETFSCWGTLISPNLVKIAFMPTYISLFLNSYYQVWAWLFKTSSLATPSSSLLLSCSLLLSTFFSVYSVYFPPLLNSLDADCLQYLYFLLNCFPIYHHFILLYYLYQLFNFPCHHYI